MQSLKIISGCRQEGKTLELVNNYLKINLINIDYKDELPAIKFRDINSIVYIDCSSHGDRGIFDINVERTLIDNFTDEEAVEFRNNAQIKYYNNVCDLTSLKQIIEDELKISDAVFCIDDFDAAGITTNDLIALVEDYPKLDISNSCDIYATKTRELTKVY